METDTVTKSRFILINLLFETQEHAILELPLLPRRHYKSHHHHHHGIIYNDGTCPAAPGQRGRAQEAKQMVRQLEEGAGGWWGPLKDACTSLHV
eukprot:scaffold78422_cov12-Tisochrysis_lutea.AAC.1